MQDGNQMIFSLDRLIQMIQLHYHLPLLVFLGRELEASFAIFLTDGADQVNVNLQERIIQPIWVMKYLMPKLSGTTFTSWTRCMKSSIVSLIMLLHNATTSLYNFSSSEWTNFLRIKHYWNGSKYIIRLVSYPRLVHTSLFQNDPM